MQLNYATTHKSIYTNHTDGSKTSYWLLNTFILLQILAKKEINPDLVLLSWVYGTNALVIPTNTNRVEIPIHYSICFYSF